MAGELSSSSLMSLLAFWYLKAMCERFCEQLRRLVLLACNTRHADGAVELASMKSEELEVILASEQVRWKSELGEAEQKIVCLKADADSLERKLERARKTEHQLKRDMEKVIVERDKLRATENRLRQRLTTHEESWRVTSMEKERKLQEIARELEYTRREHNNVDEMLQVRTRELREAQVYMGATDSKSHADILRMVENLNSVIYQAAAQIADSIQFRTTHLVQHVALLAEADRVVADMVGRPMAKLLARMVHVDDTIAVQIAIQSLLSQFACLLATTWDTSCDKEKNRILQELHLKLVEAEAGPVAAKWRILTRLHVNGPGDRCHIPPHIAGETTNAVLYILLLSRLEIPDLREILKSAAWKTFEEKVHDIAAVAGELRKAVGEEISSCEFQLICPTWNDVFNRATMDDIDAKDDLQCAGEHSDDLPILCATAVGLNRYEGRRSTEGAPQGLHYTNVLKAKVAMRSLAQQLMGQQPSQDV